MAATEAAPAAAASPLPTPRRPGTAEPILEVREELIKMRYKWRPSYWMPCRYYQLDDFLRSDWDQCEVLSQTFEHPDGTRVTLIPLTHIAHPQFYSDVDCLCGFHESVLMEGRYGNTLADATVVQAREPLGIVRPKEELDSEGWEPLEQEAFFQPYSWGVKGSKANTVIHAADKYDYEKLPWYAMVRFNIPILGTLSREKHCLNQIPLLKKSGYKTFAIPWGAAHMPIFATMLEQNNFTPTAEQRLVVWSAVDGNTSESWVKQMRVQLRLLKIAHQSIKFIPAGLFLWTCWAAVDGESPFFFSPSLKPMIPFYWVK
jgi:hypothetical protein